MFEKSHELLRWVASQFPNLPHVQVQLRELADSLEKQTQELAAEVSDVVSQEADKVAEIEAEAKLT